MPTPTFTDPLLRRPGDEAEHTPVRPVRGAPAGLPGDERLARLAARSDARRRELGRSGPPSRGTGLPPPDPRDRRPGPAGARSPGSSKRVAPRRRHAAKGGRTVALVVSVGATLGLTAYFKASSPTSEVSLGVATPSNAGTALADTAGAVDPTTAAESGVSASAATTAPATTAAVEPTTEATAATTPETTAAPPTEAPTTAAATVSASGLADGTFTGGTATNKWGPVQVQIVVEGGTITDVGVLQYPDGDRKSIAINNQALPWLEQEALTAQSADIDTVSGATYTSDSYQLSLQSAIDAARAAALAG